MSVFACIATQASRLAATTLMDVQLEHKHKQHIKTKYFSPSMRKAFANTTHMRKWNTCAARVQCSVKVCTTTLSVSHPLCDSSNTCGCLRMRSDERECPCKACTTQNTAICTHKLLHDHIKTVKMARLSSLKCALLLVCWHDDPWPTHAFVLRPIPGSLFMPPA